MASAAIKKAVENRDIKGIRAALRISLTLDHNYQSGMFSADRDYCRDKGFSDELYEPHDGRDLLAGRDTEESFATLLGHLSTNFSKERLERVLALGRKLWPREQTDGSARQTESMASSSVGSAGIGQCTDERIVGERPVSTSSTSNSAGKERVTGERIIGEREIPRGGSGAGSYDREYGSSSFNKSRESSNFPAAVVLGVAAVVAVVAAIIILA